MRISIGCDHAGYQLKNKIKEVLSEQGHQVEDCGCFSEESVDYPDFAHEVCNSIGAGNSELGILICGSGNGISMAANKHQHIRAALSWTPEIAALGRQHNNANIVSIPARYVSEEEGIEIVKTFLSTEFEGGRHERRVNKISC